MIITIFLRIQNALEIDFRQSNTTNTLYGNWADEAQLHGGLNFLTKIKIMYSLLRILENITIDGWLNHRQLKGTMLACTDLNSTKIICTDRKFKNHS